MRILVAPTAFKGSLSPAKVALAMSEGIERFARESGQTIDVDLLPIADGGDGTVESISLSCAGVVHELAVTGALGGTRIATWLEFDQSAVVELASACGIAGLGAKLRPLEATTRGLGLVLRRVIESCSAKTIIIAVGGSASTDGGCGALYELGAKFFDKDGKEFCPTGGADLSQIVTCDLSSARALCTGRRLLLATDVENVLLGPNGAAHLFGPQKGAKPEEVEILDSSLAMFADLIERTVHVEARNSKGSGAAGGTAFGLAAGLGAEIISGFDWLANLVGLSEKVRQSDLVITGEGRVDASSLDGKVVGSLNEICIRFRKPLWIIAGTVSPAIQSVKLDCELVLGVAAAGKMADSEDISRVVCEALQSRYKLD